MALLFILRPLNEHALKGVHRRENSSTKPRAVFSISRGEHFRCEVGWSKRLYFLLHTSLHSFEHRSSTGKDYVFEKVLPDVSLALNDSVVGVLMNAI